jgi:DNA-binding NtrC family response regulator
MTDDVRTAMQVDFAASGAPSAFVLTVTDGPDRGATITVDASTPGRILVGTGPASELRLSDPMVSRRHVALELTANGLRATDLGSTNGTVVDRVRILSCELQGDELLRLGGTTIQVEARDSSVGQPPRRESFGRLLGASEAMRRLYPLCDRLATTTLPVIIEGETGTGKEVLAEALHEAGPRRSGPFVVFDCTAVPPSLVESELFGHERGAFTGATHQRRGVFEQADGGTLLIDEIGDLELSLQPKLLRALERNEVRRLGGDRWIRVDVRVVSATRRNLDREVQEGRFRDDLFHRLAGARIELPALRDRHGDVELLARHMWAALGGDPRELDRAVLARWAGESWPGNVRELRNAVGRHHALGDLAVHRREATLTALAEAQPDPANDTLERLLRLELPFTEARDRIVEEFERRYVERLLAAHDGDPARAAAASGIGLRYFQKLRARHR